MRENTYLQKTQNKTAMKGEFKRTSNMKSIKKQGMRRTAMPIMESL